MPPYEVTIPRRRPRVKGLRFLDFPVPFVLAGNHVEGGTRPDYRGCGFHRYCVGCALSRRQPCPGAGYPAAKRAFEGRARSSPEYRAGRRRCSGHDGGPQGGHRLRPHHPHGVHRRGRHGLEEPGHDDGDLAGGDDERPARGERQCRRQAPDRLLHQRGIRFVRVSRPRGRRH